MARLAIALALAATTLAGVAFAASMPLSSRQLTSDGIVVSTCSLAAVADSHVDQFSSGSNFGTATTLIVESAAFASNRSFLRFDVSGCVPAGATVLAARLKLYLWNAPGGNRTHNVHRVTASWTETGITWSNQPGVAGAVTGTIATGTTAGVTKTLDVLTDVKAFVAGTQTNNGWRVADSSEGAAFAQTAEYRSDEYGTAAQRPVLEIRYYQ